MIEYKILCEDGKYDLEKEVNRWAARGYVLTEFCVAADEVAEYFAAVMEREKSQ